MRLGLQGKLLLPTLGLVVAGLFVAAYIGDRASYRAIHHAVMGQEMQTAAGIVRNAELWIQSRLREGMSWAENDIYAKAQEESLLGKSARRAAQGRLAGLLEGYGMYEAILLVRRSGEVLALAARDRPDYRLDLGGDPVFGELGAKQSVVAPLRTSPITGHPVLPLYFAVDGGGEKSGVLVAVVDLTAFGRDFLAPLAKSGSTAGFLVSETGRIFLKSQTDGASSRNVTDLGLSVAQLKGPAGVLHYRADGEVWMAAHRWIPDLKWAVVVSSAHSVVFADARKARAIALLTALLCAALVGLGVYFTAKFALAPICQTLHALKDLSEGEGDLTRRLSVRTRDEIGELAEYFNRFIEKLHHSISRVKVSSARVTSATSQLTAIAADASHGVRDQNHETDMIASAVNEMTATAQSVSANASKASQSAEASDRQAADGRKVVENTVASIKALADEVEQSVAAIEALRLGTDKIDRIVEVIEGVARQTNLLALNAGIEAARAGVHGRGFAVVAQEIRTLAQRSQGSTEEIRQMIASLQKDALAAVERTRSTRDCVQETSELASRAGASLDAITASVATITDMNHQIAVAAEQQFTVTEEINRNISNIQAVSTRTSGAAERTEASARELAGSGEELAAVVTQFKV